MNKTRIISIFIFCLLLIIQGKANEHFETGFATLIVKTSNKILHKQISTPHYLTSLTSETPSQFKEVNDSTLILNLFTYGPACVNFRINHIYKNTLLFPNNVDTLHITYIDSINFDVDYKGKGEIFFDSSADIENALRKSLFEGDYFLKKDTNFYNSASEYRDDILSRMDSMFQEVLEAIASQEVKLFMRNNLENYIRDRYLLSGYNSYLSIYNSKKKENKIPPRDLDYYKRTVSANYIDSSSLFLFPVEMLNSLVSDSILNLPDISKDGPQVFLTSLDKVFGDYFAKKNQFYDMLIATSYLKIIESRSLSLKEELDIISYFENNAIGEYLLQKNENSKVISKNNNSFYLLYDDDNFSIQTILSKYRNKVIVIDFWATWCGPCIDSFNEIKKVKDKFLNNPDVVFVYVTDETSDYNKWKGYKEVINGEHYYLYNDQIDNIYKQFSIKSLPSYLIFDKQGKLFQKSLSGYMGNTKLTEWISQALNQ